MSSRESRSTLLAIVALSLAVTTACSKVTRSAAQGSPEPAQAHSSAPQPTRGVPGSGATAARGQAEPRGQNASKVAGPASESASQAPAAQEAENRQQQVRQLQIDRLQAAVGVLEDDGYLVRKTRKKLAWRLIAPDLMWKLEPGKRPAEARRIATRLQSSVSPIMGHPVPIEVYGDLKESILLHRETPAGETTSAGSGGGSAIGAVPLPGGGH